jgi:hypothetical protein
MGRHPSVLPDQVASDIFDLGGTTLPVVIAKMRPGMVGVVGRGTKNRIVWFHDSDCEEIIRDVRHRYATCATCHSAVLTTQAKKLCRLCRGSMVRVKPKVTTGSDGK